MTQFQYMQVAHPYGFMQAYDLNAYGQQGWALVAIDNETTSIGATGIKVYTFMRETPVEHLPDGLKRMDQHEELAKDGPAAPIVEYARQQLADQPHEHQPRASRLGPVVSSDAPERPTHEKEQ